MAHKIFCIRGPKVFSVFGICACYFRCLCLVMSVTPGPTLRCADKCRGMNELLVVSGFPLKEARMCWWGAADLSAASSRSDRGCLSPHTLTHHRTQFLYVVFFIFIFLFPIGPTSCGSSALRARVARGSRGSLAGRCLSVWFGKFAGRGWHPVLNIYY